MSQPLSTLPRKRGDVCATTFSSLVQSAAPSTVSPVPAFLLLLTAGTGNDWNAWNTNPARSIVKTIRIIGPNDPKWRVKF